MSPSLTTFGIVIYDDKQRRDLFANACRSILPDRQKVPIVGVPHVYCDNLDPSSELRDLLPGTKLVFLHLGQDPLGDQQKRFWGNHRSEEFWNAKLKGRDGIAVIAYTGGRHGKPESFPEDEWHTYLYEIADASRLNLALFLRQWSENIDGPPPLHLLQVWPSLPQAFDILRVGFLAAYGGGGGEWFNELPEALRKQVQSDCNKERVRAPDWWKPVLGEDLKGEKLRATASDDKRKMVEGLIRLFESSKQPSPDEIRKALNLESGSESSKS